MKIKQTYMIMKNLNSFLHKQYESGKKDFDNSLSLQMYTAQKLSDADIQQMINQLFTYEEKNKQNDKKSDMETKRNQLKRDLFKEFGFHDEAAMIEDEKLKALFLK